MPPQPAPEDNVRLFTDGACSGNPGPGGWAFIMEHPATGRRMEQAGAEPMTTNNRMEIISALRGLAMLKRPCRVEIVTDSQYLARGISEWLPGWRANGYKRREAGKLKPLQNEDLWRSVDEQLARHEIRVTHVKGHAGHAENERCDQMAVAAYKRLMAGTLPESQAETWTERLVKTAKTQVMYTPPPEQPKPRPPEMLYNPLISAPPRQPIGEPPTQPRVQPPPPPAVSARPPEPELALESSPVTEKPKAPRGRPPKARIANPASSFELKTEQPPTAEPKRRGRPPKAKQPEVRADEPQRWDPDESF